jgi:hypothetical protein
MLDLEQQQVNALMGEILLRKGFELAADSWSNETLVKWKEFIESLQKDLKQ